MQADSATDEVYARLALVAEAEVKCKHNSVRFVLLWLLQRDLGSSVQWNMHHFFLVIFFLSYSFDEICDSLCHVLH